MTSTYKELSEELPAIESLARQFYLQLDFAHNESHGERVVANALYLHEKEGGDRSVVIAGAWLPQFHNDLEILSKALNELSLSPHDKNILYGIVEARKLKKSSELANLESKIVFDACALEIIGPYGIIREVLCNFSHRKQSCEDTVINCRVTQQRFVGKLMTDSARQLAKEFEPITSGFWEIYDSEVARVKSFNIYLQKS